jgi:hypothetical protein
MTSKAYSGLSEFNKGRESTIKAIAVDSWKSHLANPY